MGEWADYYDSEVSITQYLGNLHPHAPLFEAVVAEGSRRVLEVGVGTGMMGVFLSQWGLDVTGVDNDTRVLEIAAALGKRLNGSVSLVQGDAFRLADSLGDAQFDVAFSQGFFEHFDDEAIRELVRQQLAVASRVVFSVPGDGYPTRDFGNERLMSPARWASILDGLGGIEVSGYGAGVGLFGRLKNLMLGRKLHVLVTVTR